MQNPFRMFNILSKQEQLLLIESLLDVPTAVKMLTHLIYTRIFQAFVTYESPWDLDKCRL